MSSEKILLKYLTKEELEILNELPNFKKLTLTFLSRRNKRDGEGENSKGYDYKKE